MVSGDPNKAKRKMAADSLGKCLLFHLLLHSVLLVTRALKCEDISLSNLSHDITFEVPRIESSTVAVCVLGGDLTLDRIWGSVKVEFEFQGKTEVQFYEAESCSALNPSNQSWASVLHSFVTSQDIRDHVVFKHSPFRTSCSAVELTSNKKQDVRITVAFRVIDWYFPATFLAGLIIFYNAERLSRNSLFFYSTGVSLGLIMSLLMLVYILHRLIPGRGGAYAVLIGGWSVAAYLIQWTCGNLKDLIVNHNQWVVGYLVVVGVISFCVCYYRGPVTSDRGLDLIRWMLQLIGLTLLYMGTRSEVVSFGVISTVFLSHVIRSSGILMGVIKMMPRNWVSYRIYYFFFPPKHKFLSLEEYVIQGTEETSRALEDLREYCNSPECNTWQVVSRLKNPSRFASFMASGQHILDEEEKIYENDPTPWLTSDSDGNDSDLNNELH